MTAHNYVTSLLGENQYQEAKSLTRKTVPVARRFLGENHQTTLRMRWAYARALYRVPGATLDDLREAVTTLEDVQRTARRVLGGAYPLTKGIELTLRESRAALRAQRGGISIIEG